MRKYAEMKNGKIHSIFPPENYKGPDHTPEQIRELFAPNVMMIEITGMSPMPQIGWRFDSGEFKKEEG